MVKQRLKSKTYWLAIFVGISSNLPLIKDALAENYGITAFVTAMLIIILRELTVKPVSEK